MRVAHVAHVFATGLSGLLVACDPGVDAPDYFGGKTDGSSSSTTATSDATTTAGASTTHDGTPDTATTTSGGHGSSESTDDGFDDHGALCGDGLITGNEQCDCSGAECTDEGLNFLDCTMVDDPLAPGFLTGGVLGCNPASCRFDTSACTYCGDGEINGNEACEPELDIATTCTELGLGTAGAITCDAACQLDTTACTDCGYIFEFDTCDEGWLTGGAVGAAAAPSWACGDYGGNVADGPEAGTTGVWATNLTGNYSDVESSFLRSPVLDLSKCGNETIEMKLRHWYNFEGGTRNSDGGIVQASVDGVNWTTVTPNGGSLYAGTLNARFAPVNGSPGFSGLGDEEEWVESTFDLSAYAEQQAVYVRFVFGSDDGNTAPGWYLDRLEILGSGD